MKTPTCPICERRLEGPTRDWPHFPFCSARCKLIDLGRWFDERYRVEAEDQDDLPPQAPDAP
jgi:uncharacterized protein